MGSGQKLVTIAVVTRVRTEGSPKAEVVAELPRDTEVEVLINGDPFVQISAWHAERGRVAGWVHRSFLSGLEGAGTAPERTQIVDPPCNACGALNWVHTPAERFIHLSLLNLVGVRHRICTSCGLVQECIGAKEIEEVKSWQQSRTT
ncbi:MAG: SH3 domain-containing protein [Firmicutes bacterium]|nr:SH3 domain-containing protein [Dethiobacter sp.]MBS3888026.1 SH3 domain-containing protein [Bacillota bacterium]